MRHLDCPACRNQLAVWLSPNLDVTCPYCRVSLVVFHDDDGENEFWWLAYKHDPALVDDEPDTPHVVLGSGV